MTQSIFSCYLRLQQLPDEVKKRHKIKIGARIPRYDVTAMAGYYKPLEALKNAKGQIVFYLNETRGVINSPDTRRADKFLQGKDSFNFSSLYLLDYPAPSGNIVGYGNPPTKMYYSKDNKENPFCNCKNDGFLFLVSPDWLTIEIFILPNAANLILGYAKGLADGFYNQALAAMRSAAQPIFNY